MATEVVEDDLYLEPTTGAGIDLPSDACLVRELMEGSEEALGRLYDKHAETVYTAALRASRDRSIAAEVVQDTFLALWNRAEQFDASRGALPAWLVTIARHRSIDRLRAAGRHERAAAFSSFGRVAEDAHTIDDWLTSSGELIGAASPEPGPEIALYQKETRAAVVGALAALAPMERCVIMLAYHGGLSQSEIAARLGWPIGTVKTRTRRALQQLRGLMERARAEDGSARRRAEWVTASETASSSLSAGPAAEGNCRAWWSAVGPVNGAPATTSCLG